MGQLITPPADHPGSLPTSPTSYSQCGKSGKTGTVPKSPETGKPGTAGKPVAIAFHWCKPDACTTGLLARGAHEKSRPVPR